MFHSGGVYMGGLHGLWWIFWVVLLGVLVVFVWRRPGEDRHRRETPHEVLRRRLASGEITPEEFETRKALLDRDTGNPP